MPGKHKKKTLPKVKRQNKRFSGVCELRQLPKGTLFRTMSGKETYVKGHYDKPSKCFSSTKYSDINSERFIKGTTKVRTDFIF